MTEIKPYKELSSEKKEQIALMFDNIAGRYDFLNHFFSMGIDKIWRKKAIAKLKAKKPEIIIDIATGTGDFAIQAIKTLNPSKVVGIDISSGMLKLAGEKIKKQNLANVFSVSEADVENIPFDAGSFDAATVAFGVRNFQDLRSGLKKIHRVLKPQGHLIILEFSKPRMPVVKQLYNFYFFKILPLCSRAFSKDARAYSYLPESVEAFPAGEDFLGIIKECGFSEPKVQSLTLGICSIYTAVKIK